MKFVEGLNILGLGIGIAAAIITTGYIFNEFQIGKTQPHHTQLYLLTSNFGATHSFIALETLQNQLPELEQSTGFHGQWGEAYWKVEDKLVKTDDLLIGDASFFDVFEYQFLQGSKKRALNNKNGVVLTRSTALKLFGNENIIGKPVVLQSEIFEDLTLVVDAVVEDPESQALIQFSGLLNRAAIAVDWYKNGLNHWGNQSYLVYSKLGKDIDVEGLVGKVSEVVQNNAPDWFIQDAKSYSFENIADLHFGDIDFWGLFKKNKKSNLFTIGIISLLLLLVGWINFINLKTAQQDHLNHLNSIKRSLGASRRSLVLETVLHVLPTVAVAFLLSFLLVGIAIQPFNFFTETSNKPSDFLSIMVIGVGLLFFVFTLIVCSVLPYSLIQMNVVVSNKLRGALSVFQFSISIALIIATIAIVKQNSFVQTKDTGYESENILCLALKGDAQKKAEILGERIKNLAPVDAITYSSVLINDIQREWGMSLLIDGESKRIRYSAIEVTPDFFDFFNIPLIGGTGFTETSKREKHHIFNETALRTFGVDDITRARISSYGNANGDLVGKVKDFNFQSLRSSITPLGFIEKEPHEHSYLYVKLNSSAPKVIGQCISSIEDVWGQIETDWPAEVTFLSESTKQLYEAEQRFSKLLSSIALISILISCIGLLGVSKFVAEKRTKEIGIRKVNGAKVREILAMLNKDFVKWVAIAFVIACPIAYYAMSKWLENFAYKTTLSWWIFALAGLLALGIALLTVSWQSWKAATRNPVEALRYE